LEGVDYESTALSDILTTLASHTVVETVSTTWPLSIFAQPLSQRWAKEIPQELINALGVLVQRHPTTTLSGGIAPDFYLRTVSNELLGVCWCLHCDGFPGWVDGLFCATPLFRSPMYAFIEEPWTDKTDMKKKVERWDLEDDLDVWVECPTIWDVQYREGRGMGCGNGRFCERELRFALRPMGLFSAEPIDRYAKQSRHDSLLPSV